MTRFFVFSMLCCFVAVTAFSPDKYEAIEMDKADIRVIDGDTLVYKGKTIRILGIDTPEVSHGKKREGQPRGEEAATFTKRAVQRANHVFFIPAAHTDKYLRVLAHVVVDHELLGVRLIIAHLAYETVSYFGDSGFLELAAEIYQAAQRAGPPDFEPPWIWRREHWHQKRDDV